MQQGSREGREAECEARAGSSHEAEVRDVISGARGQSQQPTDVKLSPSNILINTSDSMSINNDGQR